MMMMEEMELVNMCVSHEFKDGLYINKKNPEY